MLTGSDPLLPSGLSAWAEMLLVLTLGVIWSNGKEMLSSLALVMGVHLLDDVIDYRRQGQQVPTKNLAHCWGSGVLLLGILCSLTALLLAQNGSFMVSTPMYSIWQPIRGTVRR